MSNFIQTVMICAPPEMVMMTISATPFADEQPRPAAQNSKPAAASVHSSEANTTHAPVIVNILPAPRKRLSFFHFRLVR